MASGLNGIRNKTKAPPMFEEDVYSADDLPEVPKSLKDALVLFEQSKFALTAFSNAVHQHYIHFSRTEVEAFGAAITDWELKRYFEII